MSNEFRFLFFHDVIVKDYSTKPKEFGVKNGAIQQFVKNGIHSKL